MPTKTFFESFFPDRLRLKKVKARLNQVSPSFCLAKWLQTTIHLHNGRTHSCHHPAPHTIPLDELADNPSALHNTLYKKSCRVQMLKGERPEECRYCWNVEDLPRASFSDRHLKSASNWAYPDFAKIRQADPNHDVNPTALEVSFSSICNFRCAYCAPDVSSALYAESKAYGPYPTTNKFGALPAGIALSEETNPYIAAFWKWWPSVYPELKVFRITGGEPLLSPNTFKVLDFIEANPNKSLALAVNSNLGIPTSLVEKLMAKLQKIQAKNAVREIRVYASIDTFGKQAEYLRAGLDFPKFEKHLSRLLTEVPDLKIVLMCTFNLLSLPGLLEFLSWVRRMKLKHRQWKRPWKQNLILDISYLEYPEFLSIQLARPELKQKALAGLRYLRRHPLTFSFQETNKLRRVVGLMKNPSWSEAKIQHQKKDFQSFIKEYDRRKGFNFLETFPATLTV